MKIIVSGGSSPEKILHLRQGTLAIFLQALPLCPKDLRVGIFPSPFHLCHSQYKSLANLNRLYVLDYAKNNDYDDAATHTYNNILLETSFGNIFWVVNQNIFTPNPDTLPLYFGITVSKMFDVLKKFNYNIHFIEEDYQNFPRHALLFRTSSLTGIKAIKQLGTLSLKTSKKTTCFFQNLYKQIKEDYKLAYFNTSDLTTVI